MTLTNSKLNVTVEKVAKSLPTERLYTVGYAPQGGKPNPKPQLTLSGRWLEELGFYRGQKVLVRVEQSQLIIQLASEVN